MSIEPRDQLYFKVYGFWYFAKNIRKNIAKTIIKNLSGKYSKKILNHPQKLAADALKTAPKSNK